MGLQEESAEGIAEADPERDQEELIDPKKNDNPVRLDTGISTKDGGGKKSDDTKFEISRHTPVPH